jgi:hypothetical protein
MIAPARAQYKIPLEWLICAPRTTLTTRQSRARIRRSEIVRAKGNVSDYGGA